VDRVDGDPVRVRPDGPAGFPRALLLRVHVAVEAGHQPADLEVAQLVAGPPFGMIVVNAATRGQPTRSRWDRGIGAAERRRPPVPRITLDA
jgi:hypothetical protein